MSWDPTVNNTYDALAAMSANSVRILWQRQIDVFEQTEDFFAQFEGSSNDSPIFTINDLSKGAGHTLSITSMAGFYGPGKSGDSMFSAEADFEQIRISENRVTVDFLRNAYAITKRTDEHLGMCGELASGAVVELGRWMGREKTARAMMTYRLKGGAENLLIAGGRATQDQLLTADGLGYNEILYMGQALKPLGGAPCEVGTVRGNPVKKYIVVTTTPGGFALKQDSDYKLLMKDAQPREKYDENPLFSGGYSELDGHSIREYNPIDHDGYGPVGSAFNAKAFTGAAITAGTASFDLLGGGSAAAAAVTNIQYFRFFPGYAFEFLPSDIYSPTSETRYLLIVNPKNATTDPGKVGMYSYTTGNVGTKITITGRLAPVTNGPVALSTLGNVSWNTGVWSTSNGGPGHTQTHPIGSTIILCNAYGVPIGDTIMMGARNMIRGYGQWRNHRSLQLWEGDFQERRFVATVFGQSLRKNVRGVYPGYVRLRHAISYPELGLPTVTA